MMNQIDSKNGSGDSGDFPLEAFVRWACLKPAFLLLILMLIGLTPILATNVLILIADPSRWQVMSPNEIGDTFGFLNALMSSLAFMGIAYAIYLQITEIKASEKAHKNLSEMQLCQSYLNGLSALVSIQLQKQGATRISYEAVHELETFLERIRGTAYEFVQAQPAHGFNFVEILIDFRNEIGTLLKEENLNSANWFIGRTMRKLLIWIPALQKSDSILDQAILNFIHNHLKPLCDGINDLSRSQSDPEHVQVLFRTFSVELEQLVELSISSMTNSIARG